MDYVVAIPSYGREDIITKKTLPLLLKAKVPASKIFIFVADKEEEAKYLASVPKEDYHQIVVGKKGISYQRNFIIDYFPEGKHIVFIDDDLSQVVRLRSGRIAPIADMDSFFRDSFKKLHDEKLFLWATKNQYSGFFKKQMKEEGEIGLLQFSGDLMGIINRKSMKISITLAKGEAEQIELLFKYVKKDGAILRFNNVVVISHKLTPGGKVKERGSVEARKRDIEPNITALAKAYPEYIAKVIERGEMSNSDRNRITDRSRVDLVKTENRFIKGGKRIHIEGEDDTTISTLPIRNKARFDSLKATLLDVLRESTVPKIPKPAISAHSNRGTKLGTIGRTITFGYGDTRRGIKEYKTNARFPELLKALIDFGNAIVPKGWDYNGITLNHGVKAKKHKDSKNLGVSYIIGIGDFTGGGIKVWDAEDKNPRVMDLHDKPVGFNGGLLFHQTTPFKGERYTIIYYKQMWEGVLKGYTTKGSGHGDELTDDHEELEGGIYA